LNKTDVVIWASSLSAILATFFIFGGNALSLISSLLGVTTLIFMAKGVVFAQVLTIVFALSYGIISLTFRYYGEMITYIFMALPIAVASLISWLKHPYKDTKVVEVQTPSKKSILVLSVLSIIVTTIFYFILKALNTPNLAVSTISITTSFFAAGLSYLRSPYYAIAYCFNDVILIILWLFASFADISYVPLVACFSVFLFNDVYGFISWNKIKNSQKA
jgi:nicotinamide mononucleotide transporter PnuC